MHAVVARSTFRCQNVQKRSDAVSRGRRKGLCTLSAVSKRMAGVGHMQRIWQDAFRVAGARHETCSSELLAGPSADFLRGCILEHQIVSFGKMILRDRCSTS